MHGHQVDFIMNLSADLKSSFLIQLDNKTLDLVTCQSLVHKLITKHMDLGVWKGIVLSVQGFPIASYDSTQHVSA